MNAIDVEALQYAYSGSSRPTVRNMTFQVAGGEVFGLLGPSGAGKTTTQRIAIGLLAGWTGRVDVFGRSVADWGSGLYDRIGIAFELPVGYPRLTVREDLVHFANLHAVPSLHPDETLARVGLADAADRPVAELSKGMRLRLNLARAVQHRPELLFLDEPTSGLDPVNTRKVREFIMQWRAEGRSVFLTTHDMATAAAVCDRIAFVVDGTIVACDSPRNLEFSHGRRRLRVTHRTVGGGVDTSVFPLGTTSPELLELLASDRVESVHSDEAGLDDVFVAVTGRPL